MGINARFPAMINRLRSIAVGIMDIFVTPLFGCQTTSSLVSEDYWSSCECFTCDANWHYSYRIILMNIDHVRCYHSFWGKYQKFSVGSRSRKCPVNQLMVITFYGSNTDRHLNQSHNQQSSSLVLQCT